MKIRIKCQGITDSGRQCNNWALKNSMYCHIHQNQKSDGDRILEQKSKNITSLIILIIGIIIIVKIICAL